MQNKLDSQYILQVITDLPAINVCAQRSLAARYPSIVFAGCSTHGVNNLMKDIGKQWAIAEIVSQAKEVIKFVNNHDFVRARFQLPVKDTTSLTTTVLSMHTDVKFGGVYYTLDRLMAKRDQLDTLYHESQFKEWVRVTANCTAKAAATITSEYINSSNFWARVEAARDLYEIFINVLDMTDTSKIPTSPKLYAAMLDAKVRLEQYIETSQCRTLENYLQPNPNKPNAAGKKGFDAVQVKTNFYARWESFHSIVQAMAYACDPEFHDHEHTTNKEVMDGMQEFLHKFYPGDIGNQVQAMNAWTMYKNKEGPFADGPLKMAWKSYKSMRPHEWWKTWWRVEPYILPLAHAAIAALSQTTSASTTERCWSTLDYVWSKKRNRLAPQRASKLVYVHMNALAEKCFMRNQSENYFVHDSDENDEQMEPVI